MDELMLGFIHKHPLRCRIFSYIYDSPTPVRFYHADASEFHKQSDDRTVSLFLYQAVKGSRHRRLFLPRTKTIGRTDDGSYSIDTPHSKSFLWLDKKGALLWGYTVSTSLHWHFLQYFIKNKALYHSWICDILSSNTMYLSLAKKKGPSACVCLSGKFDMDKNRGQQNGGVKTLVSCLRSSSMPYGDLILSHVFEWEVFLWSEYRRYCDTAL